MCVLVPILSAYVDVGERERKREGQRKWRQERVSNQYMWGNVKAFPILFCSIRYSEIQRKIEGEELSQQYLVTWQTDRLGIVSADWYTDYFMSPEGLACENQEVLQIKKCYVQANILTVLCGCMYTFVRVSVCECVIEGERKCWKASSTGELRMEDIHSLLCRSLV